MNRRKGFSLVEVLVAVTVGSVLLAVAVGLLYALIEMDRTSREHLRLRIAAARLGDQFRRDVHAAVRLTGPQEGAAGNGAEATAAWELDLPPDRAVEYRLEEASLLRTERAGGEVVRREWFRLPPHAVASIERSGEQGHPIVSLRITPDLKSPEAPAWRPVRIDAALATDHRFVNVEGR